MHLTPHDLQLLANDLKNRTGVALTTTEIANAAQLVAPAYINRLRAEDAARN